MPHELTVFIMSFRRTAVSWKDRFDLKRDVTCLCDYQSTKIQSEEIMFQLNSVIFWKKVWNCIERNLRCLNSQGTRRPPTPGALLVDKHFGQMATKRRRCKFFAYFRNTTGNLKHIKTNNVFVECKMWCRPLWVSLFSRVAQPFKPKLDLFFCCFCL